MKTDEQVIIIGGGISGLATATFLQKEGVNALILESQNQPGGVMRSEQKDDFVFDFGSNSAILKYEEILELIDYAGARDAMLTASRESSKRLILKDDKLHALSGPISMITTKLFSPKAKFKVLGEFRRKPLQAEGDESMANFVARRLGQEIVDYAVSPLIAGIYAGRPQDISMKANYPDMLRAEREFGSVMKGMMKIMKEKKAAKRAAGEDVKKHKHKREIFSFKGGMQQLAHILADKAGDKLVYNAKVSRISKKDEIYTVEYEIDGKKYNKTTRQIVSTAPAQAAAVYFENIDATLSNQLRRIYYPPVIVSTLVYNRADIATKLDSFGFLIPEKEKKAFLGAIWSSVIFPNRATEQTALFTLFIGGSINPSVIENTEQAVEKARSEFEKLMEISGKPVVQKVKVWEKAIPQYNMDYPEIAEYMDKFEETYPGITISGNYRKGFATGDCIFNAKANALKIAGLLK